MKLGQFQSKIKKIGIIVFLFVLLGGMIFAGQQTSLYFAKADSCGVDVNTVSTPKNKLTQNSAIIHFETTEATKGQIFYGTNNTLGFLADKDEHPSPSKIHDIVLETFITPNTEYNYVVGVDGKFCDRSGKTCDTTVAGNCQTWSLRTLAIGESNESTIPTTVATSSGKPIVSPTKAASGSATPKVPTTIPSLSKAPVASPTSSLTPLCQGVTKNIGSSSKDATSWATLKQYDIDNNNVVNGLDVIKCQSSGR